MHHSRTTAALLVFLLFPAIRAVSLVPVRFTIDRSELPAYWWKSPYNARFTPLPASRRAAARAFVRRELTRYPVGFPERHLNAVHLLKKLSFYGMGYGGSYSDEKKRVYACYYGWNMTYNRQVIHEEFSSLLFNRYKYCFPRAAWITANRPGFRYGKGGISALAGGKSGQSMTPDWFRRGFLYQYATAALEEDFNSIASNLFYNSPRFIEAVRTSAIIKRKVWLAISFYQKMDQRFTETRFNRFSLGRLLSALAENSPGTE